MRGVPLSVLRNGLRWQDAVDVLLLTLVFSRLYAWLRRTVAVQIAFGLITLVAASWIASHLGLILTSYLLSAVGAVAAVVVVVVFQHEIRQGLRSVSLLRWMTRRRAPGDDVAAAVARAAFGLSDHRKGGLIVIPGEDSIAEHVTPGTQVDAALSAPLLEAIFTSTSALHDGAVVLAGGRVARAGVVLPLATEVDDIALGTRHRAALGLTDACDALVVCVSEERGTVSVAHEGRLEPTADEAALERALAGLGAGRTHAVRERPARRFPPVRELWAHAAIFAVVLVAWAAMALDRSHAVARIVPLEVRGVTDAIAFDAPRFTSIAVELRSSRRELEILPPDAVTAYIDLTGAAAGPRTYRVLTSAPAGIDVVSTTPSAVQLIIRPRGGNAAAAAATTPAAPASSAAAAGPGLRGRPPGGARR
jgi:uncharacterized protein (TIGR00159 family)